MWLNLSHTWLLSLIPDEQAATSGVSRRGRAPRTERKAEQNTPRHVRTLSYTGKTCVRWLKGKAFSLWKKRCTNHTTCLLRSDEIYFCCSLPSNWWSALGTKLKSFKKNHFQTDRILHRMTTQTVLCRGSEWHSIILSVCKQEELKFGLWFKAQTNRKGNRALCFLSALHLDCKVVRVKGSWKGYLFNVM